MLKTVDKVEETVEGPVMTMLTSEEIESVFEQMGISEPTPVGGATLFAPANSGAVIFEVVTSTTSNPVFAR